MDVFALRESLVDQYASFARSFTAIRAADIRAQVEQEYDGGRFWPEPLLNDSPLFLDISNEDALPLYEAKMIHQFDHRWATYDNATENEDSARDVSVLEKADPELVVRPRYWLPRDAVVRHTARVPDALFLAIEREDEDIATQVIAQWFAGYYLNRGDDARGNELLVRALGTSGTPAKAMTSWFAAKSLEQKFPLTPEDEARLHHSGSSLEVAKALVAAKTPGWLMGWRDICRATDELDAYYAHLYGLTRDELRYVLDPADVMGPDYPGETFRVLKQNEQKQYGEYRTRRLVLEAWDRLFPGL